MSSRRARASTSATFRLFLAALLALLSLPALPSQAASLGFANRAGSTGSDAGIAVATDPSGNVYVTGSFEGTVDFDPGHSTPGDTLTSAGDSDIYVARYSPAGALTWVARIGSGGPADDGAANRRRRVRRVAELRRRRV